MMPICFYRTMEEQRILLRQGKSKTLASKHLRWLAIDLLLIKDGNPVWERTSEYNRAGHLWRTIDGIWGGDWKGLEDIYHFEFKE